MTPQQRFAWVLRVKAAVATVFLVIVALTLRHPVSLAFGALDLLLIPLFWRLSQRDLAWATHGLVVQTALFLLPRQFVQGYVNGVNWVIYLVLPAAAVFVLGTPRAAALSTALTALVAAPSMAVAIWLLPPHITRSDVITLAVFVLSLMTALAFLLVRGSVEARR
ncbi:MAG: hypothetical protein NZL91_02450 [Thermoflexales bacterium]|nr:hypothetical protein [Thermoflexales bacterium]MDW8292083.1 hypothetical protein [Anaerolineae bacterium]